MSIKSVWGETFSKARGLVNIFTDLAIFVAVLAMILSTGALIAITYTQVSVAFNFSPNQVLKGLSDCLLTFAGAIPENLKPEQYVAALSAIVGAVSVIVTLWFSFTTTIAFFRQKSELKRLSLIQEHTIYKEGIDLDVMYRYYKDADWVVVFSGDYSWLAGHHQIARQVERLASENKITLVSYKNALSAEIGEQRLGKIEHRLKYSTAHKLKCSVVCIGQRTVFLYVADTSADDEGKKKVCVISGKDNAYYLLNTITELISEFVPNS